MYKKALTLLLCVSCTAMLFGCGKTLNERKIEKATVQIMEENPSLTEEEAVKMAEEQVAEEENIKKRLRAGEKIDGYNGHFVCKDEVAKASWNSGLIQVGDMVFDERLCMTPDDVRKVVENSKMELVVNDTFSGTYKAVEVNDKKGNKVLSFYWNTVSEFEDNGNVPAGNYLSMVIPTDKEKYAKWNVECVYLPGGYPYFYNEVASAKEEAEGFKKLSRSDFLSYLESEGFADGSLYNFGMPGCYFHSGDKTTTVTFADNDREREVRQMHGDEQVRQVFRKVKFMWNTQGDLESISISPYESRWVSSSTWYDLSKY